MKRAAILSALAIALASPAPAFDIDYSAVFAAHPDRITRTGDTTRRLELDGPVHVIETAHSDGSRSYYGYDQSPFGSVACMMNIMIDLTIAAGACKGLLSDSETQTLSQNLTLAAGHVAANAVPKVTDVAPALAALIDARKARLLAIGIACPNGTDGDQQVLPMTQMLASPQTTEVIRAMTATPRLPVPNPCAEP